MSANFLETKSRKIIISFDLLSKMEYLGKYIFENFDQNEQWLAEQAPMKIV
jgi:hypothetical protein